MVKTIFHQVGLFCKAITAGLLTDVFVTQLGQLSRAGMKLTDRLIYIYYSINLKEGEKYYTKKPDASHLMLRHNLSVSYKSKPGPGGEELFVCSEFTAAHLATIYSLAALHIIPITRCLRLPLRAVSRC